ncbi:LamG-like jellyroll fold domain-containing protein [Thaumasiovibrio sp. DFM-14]|uniref:LamG-like jellyroll fold domain-containing protein n=1 Tax=Thaumasiovibrio sp. DFM-14 TaxID=3384792 RepID=UPI0039A029F9
MSLIAWYPLHKDTKDWSGNNNHLSFLGGSASVTHDASTPLGRGYRRSVPKSAGWLRAANKIHMPASNGMTIACWAKVNETVGQTANGLVTNHNNRTNSGMGITVRHASNDDYRICCNTGTGDSRTFHTYFGKTNIKGSWHHLILRQKGTTFELLVDGKVEFRHDDYAQLNLPDHLDLFHWSTDYNSSVYDPAVELSDVRVYDHWISDKEVKDISKALQAHYDFKGLKPKFENRIHNSGFTGAVLRTPENSTIGWDWDLHPNTYAVPGWLSGFNGGADLDRNRRHAHHTLFQNEICVWGNNLDGGWQGMSHNVFSNSDIDCGEDPYYTEDPDVRRKGRRFVLSVDVYGEDIGEGIPHWRVGLYRPLKGTELRSFAKTVDIQPTKSKQWQRLTVEFEIDDRWDWSRESVATLYFYSHYGAKGDKYFKNAQFEFGTHVANPYAENDETGRFTTTEVMTLHDVSGLGHDADLVTVERDYTDYRYGHPVIREAFDSHVVNSSKKEYSPCPSGATALVIPHSGNRGRYSENNYWDRGSSFSWRCPEYTPPAENFTWCAWMNRDSQISLDSKWVSCGAHWGVINGGFSLGTGWDHSQAGGTLYGGVGGTQIASNALVGLTVDDEWQHLAVTYRGATGETLFYVNGVLKYTHQGEPRAIGAGNGILKILDCARVADNTTATFLGAVADMRIYGTVLSKDDIIDIMNVKAEVTEQGEFFAKDLIEGWDDKGELVIDVVSVSNGASAGTYINDIKQGRINSSRGLNFCIFDTGMNLRGYGNLDTYSGTTSQYYEWGGEVIVNHPDQVDGANGAANYIKDAIDRMEDGWLLTIAMCDASTGMNASLFDDYLKPMFGCESDPRAVETRGTWLLAGLKNGRKMMEYSEGRRRNDDGAIVYYRAELAFTGDFHAQSVSESGALNAGSFSEVGNTNGLIAFFDHQRSDDSLAFSDATWSKDSNYERNSEGLISGHVITADADLMAQCVDNMTMVIAFTPKVSMEGEPRTGLCCVGDYTHGLSLNFGVNSHTNFMQAYYRCTDSANNYVSASFPIPPLGEMCHMVVVKSGENIKFYLNGALVRNANDAIGWIAGGAGFASGRTYAGELRDNLFSVQKFKVFNRALTESEIFQEQSWIEGVAEFAEVGICHASEFSEL